MKYLEEQDVYIINGDEMRKIQHALWMARALRASVCVWLSTMLRDYELGGTDEDIKCWEWVHRKCLEKAKEFE